MAECSKDIACASSHFDFFLCTLCVFTFGQGWFSSSRLFTNYQNETIIRAVFSVPNDVSWIFISEYKLQTAVIEKWNFIYCFS